jgi:sulfate transport system permease protein
MTARWLGIPCALFLIAVILVLPLAAVFTEALARGLPAALAAAAEPDALRPCA